MDFYRKIALVTPFYAIAMYHSSPSTHILLNVLTKQIFQHAALKIKLPDICIVVIVVLVHCNRPTPMGAYAP
jgi:hypothetical protein